MDEVKKPFLSEMTYETASDYIIFRQNKAVVMPNGSGTKTKSARKGVSQKTMYNEKYVLQQLFDGAVARDYLSANPFRKIKVPKPKADQIRKGHHPLTEEEEGRLLDATRVFDLERKPAGDADLCDIFSFMLWTGLREGEVINLVWDDVNFDEGVITVGYKKITEVRTIPLPDPLRNFITTCMENKHVGESLFTVKDLSTVGRSLEIRAKQDLLALTIDDVDLNADTITYRHNYEWEPKQTQGMVPMCNKVRTLLERLRQKAEHNFVFAHHDGGRCRLKLLRHLNAIQKKADIDGRLRLDDLRHTFAVRLRERGCPLDITMGIMRHADIKEPLIYAPYDIKGGLRTITLLDG